jgi:hypothetical protein
MLGISGLTLPANVMDILSKTGADTLQVQTTPGHADILLDGTVALSLDYDVDSLRQVVATAKPFANVALLDDPNISKLVDEVVLPMVAGSQIDLTVDLP